ncbi:MAG: hypothetical protein HC908_06775 [Calothrix sp. SM1_7_51]|nr:hypothetical protein [Calothrix sp. SM1_7_51]
MLDRASSILNQQVDLATINKLNLSNSDPSKSRANLYQHLLVVQSEKTGIQSQAKALDEQIAQLEERLAKLSQQESKLEDLKREVQIAEAVFSSTIARLDLAKSSTSASYPEIQIFSPPSLPTIPTSPKTTLALLASSGGSLFTSIGMIVLTLGKKQKLKYTENASNNSNNNHYKEKYRD